MSSECGGLWGIDYPGARSWTMDIVLVLTSTLHSRIDFDGVY